MPWTAADGHQISVVQRGNGRWVASCSCGYNEPHEERNKRGKTFLRNSTTRATQEAALGQAIWHLRTPDREAAKVAQDLRRNGVSTTLS